MANNNNDVPPLVDCPATDDDRKAPQEFVLPRDQEIVIPCDREDEATGNHTTLAKVRNEAPESHADNVVKPGGTSTTTTSTPATSKELEKLVGTLLDHEAHLTKTERSNMLYRTLLLLNKDWQAFQMDEPNLPKRQREFEAKHQAFAFRYKMFFKVIQTAGGLDERELNTLGMLHQTATNGGTIDDFAQYGARKYMKEYLKEGVTPIDD